MKNQGASAAELQSALHLAKELEDQNAILALSVRIDAVAGRLAAAVMSAARNGTHLQYARVLAEAEAVKLQQQKCFAVSSACPHACVARWRNELPSFSTPTLQFVSHRNH
jgi:hypothetical protein